MMRILLFLATNAAVLVLISVVFQVLGIESILAENESDFAYASIMGLWLQPAAYGGGRAENVKIAWQDYPEAMQKEIEGWTERFPKNVAFVEKLYAERC